MPRQGPGTNDYGAWMCVMASLYIKELLDLEVFFKLKQVDQNNIIHSITVGMGMSLSVDVTRLGRTGREHILTTLRAGQCNLEHDCCVSGPVNQVGTTLRHVNSS